MVAEGHKGATKHSGCGFRFPLVEMKYLIFSLPSGKKDKARFNEERSVLTLGFKIPSTCYVRVINVDSPIDYTQLFDSHPLPLADCKIFLLEISPQLLTNLLILYYYIYF